MLKKIASPFLYAIFFVPVLVGAILIITVVERTVGLSRITLVGAPELALSIIVVGSLLFWPANLLIIRLEKPLKLSIFDHFRQSSLYYLASLYAFMFLVRYGYHGGLGEGSILITLAISGWAIVLNAIFLKCHKRFSLDAKKCSPKHLPRMPKSDQEPVVIATCADIVEAERIKATLVAERIPCFIDEGAAKINPFLIGAIGWIKIFVSKNSAEQAKEILSQEK